MSDFEWFKIVIAFIGLMIFSVLLMSFIAIFIDWLRVVLDK